MTDAQEWVERFPGLSRLEPPIKQLLLSRRTIIGVPSGIIVFGPRNPSEQVLFFWMEDDFMLHT